MSAQVVVNPTTIRSQQGQPPQIISINVNIPTNLFPACEGSLRKKTENCLNNVVML